MSPIWRPGRADYEALLDAHAEGWVGTHDAAVIEKADHGKVHVHKPARLQIAPPWGVAI